MNVEDKRTESGEAVPPKQSKRVKILRSLRERNIHRAC